MFKPRRLTLEELIERLCAYEEKYGYSTIEFYRRYERGELGPNPSNSCPVSKILGRQETFGNGASHVRR